MKLTIHYDECGCDRCGGSGLYHVGSAAGAEKRTCYKCGGVGRIVSRRGIYARSKVRKMLAAWRAAGVDVMHLSPERLAEIKAVAGVTVS